MDRSSQNRGSGRAARHRYYHSPSIGAVLASFHSLLQLAAAATHVDVNQKRHLEFGVIVTVVD